MMSFTFLVSEKEAMEIHCRRRRRIPSKIWLSSGFRVTLIKMGSTRPAASISWGGSLDTAPAYTLDGASDKYWWGSNHSLWIA